MITLLHRLTGEISGCRFQQLLSHVIRQSDVFDVSHPWIGYIDFSVLEAFGSPEPSGIMAADRFRHLFFQFLRFLEGQEFVQDRSPDPVIISLSLLSVFISPGQFDISGINRFSWIPGGFQVSGALLPHLFFEIRRPGKSLGGMQADSA